MRRETHCEMSGTHARGGVIELLLLEGALEVCVLSAQDDCFKDLISGGQRVLDRLREPVGDKLKLRACEKLFISRELPGNVYALL